jgi:hypothetical protein
MNAIYVQPPDEIPPQLSKADLARLTPAEIVQADDAGQCEVIRSGRDPLEFERRGERRATEEEAIAQMRAAVDEADRMRQANRAAARNEGLEIN